MEQKIKRKEILLAEEKLEKDERKEGGTKGKIKRTENTSL